MIGEIKKLCDFSLETTLRRLRAPPNFRREKISQQTLYKAPLRVVTYQSDKIKIFQKKMRNDKICLSFDVPRENIGDSRITGASVKIELARNDGTTWTRIEQDYTQIQMRVSNDTSSLSAALNSSDSAVGNIRRPNYDAVNYLPQYDADTSEQNESFSWISDTTDRSRQRRNELMLIGRERNQGYQVRKKFIFVNYLTKKIKFFRKKIKL